MRNVTVATVLLVLVCAFGRVGNLRAFDIAFDGFCDGVSLEVDQETGLVNGFLTGCIDSDIMGFVGGVENQGRSIVLTYPDGSVHDGLITFVRDDGTWSHYVHDGRQMIELSTGTWSRGMPVVADGCNLTSSLEEVQAEYASRIIKKDPAGVKAISKKPPAGVKVISDSDPPEAGVINKKDPAGVK